MKRILKKFLGTILPASVFRFIRLVKNRIVHELKLLSVKRKIKKSLPLKKKRGKIKFEIHLAEHCNLNCYACNNFSCIAEPEFVDVEEFRRDFVRMGEIFGHDSEIINLMGGEPLLHPDIITLMKIARENFEHCKDIHIFTNGILLTKMTDDFWKACRDNDVNILVSAYPIKINMPEIQARAKKFGVKCQWAWDASKSTHDLFSVAAINLGGDSDMKLAFGMCVRANNCIMLSHGKLFTCTFAPNVRHFNKKFNQNVVITEKDYVNIYEDFTADEILQRLSEPIPACRYCRIAEQSKFVKWNKTAKNINEWL